MSKPIQQELDDIFNISRDGSNIKSEDESQEGAYAAVANSNTNAPFDEKASIVAKKLAEVAKSTTEVEFVDQLPKVVPPLQVVKDEPPKAVQVPIKQEVSTNETKPQIKAHEQVLAEALSGKGNGPVPAPQVDARPPVRDDSGDGESDDGEEHEVRPDAECDTGSDQSPQGATVTAVVENSDGWLLESPAPKYNQFYAEKGWMIPRLLRGGKIPVDQYRKELSSAYVDTKVEMYDHEMISQKMTDIRKWQDRVLEIRGHVLAQYHGWKRGVELFHGVLARAEYAKPAICQQGIIYNHMRDMEMYNADLEYLHDFSKEILSNLASHFESLSRQVTLSMPLKTVERYEQPAAPLPPPLALPATPKPVPKKSDLAGFDRLENDVNQKDSGVKKPNKDSKSAGSNSPPKKHIDWAEIA